MCESRGELLGVDKRTVVARCFSVKGEEGKQALASKAALHLVFVELAGGIVRHSPPTPPLTTAYGATDRIHQHQDPTPNPIAFDLAPLGNLHRLGHARPRRPPPRSLPGRTNTTDQSVELENLGISLPVDGAMRFCP